MLTNDLKYFDLGDIALLSGETLANARIAYQTFGSLNQQGDNCVVLPTYYTGTHRSYAPLIGPGRALDPSLWFIVIPNLFGNGLSTSPSSAATPAQRARFPQVSIFVIVYCIE
jgi:homoserine O-acetyltransferase